MAVRIDDLPAASWTVRLERWTGADWVRASEERVVELPAGTEQEVVLAALDRRFEGRVLDAGRGMAAELVFRPRDLRDPTLETISDADGRFELQAGERPALYDVRVQLPQGSEAQDDRITGLFLVTGVFLEDPETPVELELPEGRIAGWVVDEAGRPMAGAVVRARAEIGRDGERAGTDAVRVETGPDGAFELDRLPAGAWFLTAEHEHGDDRASSAPERIDLEPDERIDGVRLVLGASRSIQGVVLGADGSPVSGARGIVAVPGLVRRFETDAAGRFEVEIPAWVERAEPDGVPVLVSAPGHPTTTARLAGDRAIVHLPSGPGGALEVTLPVPMEARAALPVGFRLRSELGVVVPFGMMDGREWRLEPVGLLGTEDRQLYVQTVPGLAPGLWGLEMTPGLLGGEVRQLGVVEILPGQVTRVEAPDPLASAQPGLE